VHFFGPPFVHTWDGEQQQPFDCDWKLQSRLLYVLVHLAGLLQLPLPPWPRLLWRTGGAAMSTREAPQDLLLPCSGGRSERKTGGNRTRQRHLEVVGLVPLK